jgi:kynurenine formamidase
VTRLIDLSMPVHRDMLTFPRVPPPTLLLYESWEEFAERIGAAAHGADWLTASYLVIQNDHVGTHVDAVKHLRGPDAPGPEGIPLEYCFSDGVCLDFRHKEKGTWIMPDEIDEQLATAGYTLKPRDIVLIHTGAGAYNTEERYRTDHCGMTAEATRHLIDQGVRMMGIDAITFDPPVWSMFEHKRFWEAHRVMIDTDYWHVENIANLDQLPTHGFKLSVLPIAWQGTTAAPCRAMAILDE